MKTRAALLRNSPGKLEIVELDLDEPRKNELLVRMVAAGLCHSDDHAVQGDTTYEHYPMVVGHEGAGIVEAVGPGTEGWEIGDHVVFSFIPACGACRWCVEGRSNLCDWGRFQIRGCRPDDPDSFRLSLDGVAVGQAGGLGTFAEHTLVHVHNAIKVDKSLPLDVLCLLGCGVGTGWGSAVHSGNASPGDVVIVMGVGGIGINAVQGARHAGATTIVAVDPVPFKRETARQLGATHAFASIGEATDYVRSITNGQGADVAIVSVGVTTGVHVAEAVEAIRKGGTTVVTGIGKSNDFTGIPIDLFMFTMMEKRIQGALFGGCNPKTDIPRQIRMYEAGQLVLDPLITRRYTLDEVTQGYEDLHAGVNIRGLISFTGRG